MYSIPFNMSNPIPDYDKLRQASFDRYAVIPGQEPGDPQRGMEIVADIVRGEGVLEGKTWPWCLLLGITNSHLKSPTNRDHVAGNDAERDLNQRWEMYQGVFEEWAEVTRSVDLDQDDTLQ